MKPEPLGPEWCAIFLNCLLTFGQKFKEFDSNYLKLKYNSFSVLLIDTSKF